MEKVCACGKTFETDNLRRTKCAKDCGRSNKSRNAARTTRRTLTEFIGVDGEGVTKEDGTHEYVLISVGDNSLYREDGAHLHWREIFPFLYGNYLENPNAAYVGFFLGYDFTQWFRTLPESRAEMLLTKDGIAKRQRRKSGGNPTPFPVHLGEWEWEIDILGTKRFKLRPGTGFPPATPGIENKAGWMVICDSGSFFQMSFLRVITPEIGKLVTQEEYDIIAEGKARRSDAHFDTAMIKYNTLENDILGRVVGQLNEGFRAVGINLKRGQWFGPGQAAQEWMTKIGAPTGEEIRKIVPEYAREAARKSYFGGWFEIFRHGIIPGTSYEYDINSAYPYIISRLPCLLHGTWKEGKWNKPMLMEIRNETKAIRLLHGLAEGSNKYVGAMLYRTQDGRVLRPGKTSGWYWEHEINAAMRAGIIDSFFADEYVEYLPCDCPAPFRDIESLYLERLKVGKESSHGKAYKLIYNSAYGKMAQSVGNPKYSNAIYASLITTGCRTMILDAIASHPRGIQDLLMVATDGVYFKSRHPSLPLNDEALGMWGSKQKENLTLLMPGIYWDDKSRELVKEGKAPSLKSRGISAADLAACIEELDIQFRAMAQGEDVDWPTMTLTVNFSMVSATQALAWNRWEKCGVVTQNDTRVINSNPKTKRVPSTMFRDEDDENIIATYAYSEWEPTESTPYDKRFGEEMRAFTLEFDRETPDGMLTLLLPEALGMKE